MDSLQASLSKFPENSEECCFFEKLFQKLGKRFIRSSIQREVQEAKNFRDDAIQQYFQYFTILNAVIRAQENENQGKKTADNISPMYLRLVKKYLPETSSCADLKPLGLSQEDLIKVLETKSKNETDHVVFVESVEKNLDDFCFQLYKAIDSCSITALPNRDWRDAFDNTFKDLERLSVLMVERSDQVEQLLKEMQHTYYKELSEGLSLVNKLHSLHEMKLDFESHLTQYFSLRCEALCSKTGLFEMDVLKETYTKETLLALRKISDELDVKKKKLELELAEKNERVEAYKWLGDKYESLVEEYTRLTKCIVEQKWALDELQKRTNRNILS